MPSSIASSDDDEKCPKCLDIISTIARQRKSIAKDVNAFLKKNPGAVVDVLLSDNKLMQQFEKLVVGEDWGGVQRELRQLFPAIGNKVIENPTFVATGTMDGLHLAWKKPFTGNALINLCKVLDALEGRYRNASYYAKILPIIQSSGVGKSRLVDELSKQRVGLYFALRKKGQSGYPPGDHEITEFFLKARTKHSAAAGFMASAIEFLSKSLNEHGRQAFATHLHDLLAPIAKVNTSSSEASSNHHQVRAFALLEGMRSEARKRMCTQLLERTNEHMQLFKQDPTWSKIFTDACPNYDRMKYNTAFQEYVVLPLERLLSKLDPSSSEAVPLIFMFDEISNIEDGNASSAYMALRRVLRALDDLPVWTLVLSTQSGLTHVTPLIDDDPSARVKEQLYDTVTPFTSFPLDIELNRMLSLGEGCRQQLTKPLHLFNTIEHMTMIGRPLWGIYEAESCHIVRQMALLKLLSTGQYSPLNHNHVFAVLNSRICLTPCTTQRAAVEFTMAAVHSHLRIILSVDLKNGNLETTTISEPLVSEAVADMLMSHKPQESEIWFSTISTLVHQILFPGIIDRGRSGELTARLLFIIARDQLLLHQGGPTGNFGFAQCFKVNEFLAALLTTTQRSKIMHFKGKRIKGKRSYSLNEGFAGAVMNFTHFVSTARALKPGPGILQELLHNLIFTQAALQLSEGQESWDLLIPTYFGDPKMPFDCTKLSAIVVQVKHRKEAKKWHMAEEIYKPYFGDISNPVLTIVLELGASDAEEKVIPIASFARNYFGITIMGHGLDTYSCMNPRLHSILDELLGIKKHEDVIIQEQMVRHVDRFYSHSWKGRFPDFNEPSMSVDEQSNKKGTLSEGHKKRKLDYVYKSYS